MKSDSNKSYKHELRAKAERFIKSSPSSLKDIPADDIKRLIEDLQVHQIELEMQNEELRKTQLELETAYNRYADLYDFAPIGYFSYDELARIQKVNLTGADLLDCPRSKLLNMKLSSFVAPDDQDDFYLHRKRLFESGTSQSCILKLKKQDGTAFYAKLDSVAVRDKINNLKHIGQGSPAKGKLR